MRQMLSARRTPLHIFFAVIGLAASQSLAQSMISAGPERAEDLASRALARAAMIDLKQARTPDERDFRIAAAVLEIAHKLSPREQQVLRLLIEARSSAGENDRVLELTRELVALDPADTVAQLRLITGKISNLQKVEDRLAAYDRFLGPQGESLDASIRSRLALDAALLLRERGDIEGFADKLALSLELDATNKDAATLALTFYSDRASDPIGRFDLLMSVLYADPYDLDVHRAVAKELARAGAFKGAERFIGTLDRLYVAERVVPTAEEDTFREVVIWSRQGAQAIARQLGDALDDQRKEILRKRMTMQARGAIAEDLPAIEDVRLSLGSERTRLLASAASENMEHAASSMSELAESSRRYAEQLADPTRREKSLSEADAQARIQAILSEVVWLRLWSNQQVDEAATGLAVLRKNPTANTADIARLDAWLELRRGDAARARQLLTDLAASDPMADLGLAVLDEQAKDLRSALESYVKLAMTFSGELLGAYARTRIAMITGAELQPNETARSLEDAVAGIPDWLETTLENPARVTGLQIDPDRIDIRVMERSPLRFTITNLSPLAMGFGPNRPISSRFLLVPTAEVQATTMSGGDLIEVASLDRRLRLLPRESVEVSVWGDGGTLGLLLDMSASGPTRVRWRALQGFRIGPDRAFDRGVHSVAADSPQLSRRPNPRFLLDADGLRTAIETGGPREIGEAILSFRARQARTSDAPALTLQDTDSVLDAAAVRFSTVDKPTKLLILGVLPSPVVSPSVHRIDDVARADIDADVLLVAMALRTPRAENEVFTSAAVTSNAAFASIAEDIRSRLSDGRQTYANLASDVKPAVPPLTGPPKPVPASK